MDELLKLLNSLKEPLKLGKRKKDAERNQYRAIEVTETAYHSVLTVCSKVFFTDVSSDESKGLAGKFDSKVYLNNKLRNKSLLLAIGNADEVHTYYRTDHVQLVSKDGRVVGVCRVLENGKMKHYVYVISLMDYFQSVVNALGKEVIDQLVITLPVD